MLFWGEGSVLIIGIFKLDIMLIILVWFGFLFVKVDSLFEEEKVGFDVSCDLFCIIFKWGLVMRVGEVGDIGGGSVLLKKCWIFFCFCKCCFLCKNNFLFWIVVFLWWNVYVLSRLDFDKGLVVVV